MLNFPKFKQLAAFGSHKTPIRDPIISIQQFTNINSLQRSRKRLFYTTNIFIFSFYFKTSFFLYEWSIKLAYKLIAFIQMSNFFSESGLWNIELERTWLFWGNFMEKD